MGDAMDSHKGIGAAIEPLESRLFFAVAEAAAVARPSYNTGAGFFVRDAKVYDANGYQFTIRGFSHTTWWGDANKSLNSIGEFKKTGANAVRVVFGTGFGPSQPPAQRQGRLERYIKQGIVPIVEDHMATGHWEDKSLQTIIDRRTQPGKR